MHNTKEIYMVTIIAVVNERANRITVADASAYELVDALLNNRSLPAHFVGHHKFCIEGGELMAYIGDTLSEPINTDPLLEAAARFEAANS
jgi:hypothetical protein